MTIGYATIDLLKGFVEKIVMFELWMKVNRVLHYGLFFFSTRKNFEKLAFHYSDSHSSSLSMCKLYAWVAAKINVQETFRLSEALFFACRLSSNIGDAI